MPQINFYILSESRPRDSFVCQLAAKIWQQGQHKLLILVADKQQQQLIDERLWTFNDISFIPHGSNESAITSDIYISTDCQKTPQDVLMNLSGVVPESIENFSKVLEIVSAHNDDKKQARERYRYYQEQGYSIEDHQIQ